MLGILKLIGSRPVDGNSSRGPFSKPRVIVGSGSYPAWRARVSNPCLLSDMVVGMLYQVVSICGDEIDE